MNAPARIDHLVIAAADLAQGVAWCERTLGVSPGPGGAHPLMGTHNRLLRLDADPTAAGEAPPYLEIIAIDPAATPTRAPAQRRWFDLDDPTLQAQLRRDGPALVHWVARVPDAAAAVAALAAQGLERGPVIAASRATPEGPLSWRITVRDDGQRLLGGALPTLIQWGERHPATHMAPSGLGLRALRLRHPQPDRLRAALDALGPLGVDATTVVPGTAGLSADLLTPLGPVTLNSP